MAVNDDGFGAPRLDEVLTYRKVAIAVVATYLGLDDAFAEAVLADQMDAYLHEQELARERLKVERYDEYLSLLAREAIVRYAASAAESLAASPESALATRRIPGDPGVMGSVDEINAMVRVHEIFELLESPDGGEGADRLLQTTKRHLCSYYSACAYDLVKDTLLPAILTATEEWMRFGTLTPARTRELIIAGQ